jgi:DNA-binding response OmpR family regulator
MRALVIESDVEARRALEGLLDGGGIGFIGAADGSSGLKLFYSEHPDVVVLNLGLSEPGGWKVLSAIRELSDVPVLGLSSLDGEMETVKGLRAGADDFMTTPVGRQEILARIESLLRRRTGKEQAPDILADDFLQIDRQRHRAEVLGVKVELTPIEFRMLTAFADHPGQALTHLQLLEMAWGDGNREEDQVKLYVSYLRRKLREAASIDPVETVRGIGYRYEPRSLIPRSYDFQPQSRSSVSMTAA